MTFQCPWKNILNLQLAHEKNKEMNGHGDVPSVDSLRPLFREASREHGEYHVPCFSQLAYQAVM